MATEKQITINLDIETAKKLSIALNNLCINDNYEISNALSNLYDFNSIMMLTDLGIKLKSLIDIELNQTERN